jgi:hypothetical protein
MILCSLIFTNENWFAALCRPLSADILCFAAIVFFAERCSQAASKFMMRDEFYFHKALRRTV